MQGSKNLYTRFLIALSSMILYVLIFLVLYPYVGVTAATANIIPAAVFGWFLGTRGGLIYGLFA